MGTSRCARAVARRIADGFAWAAIASFAGLPAIAQATLSVTPVTWNVVGLDSNSPASGPQNFPIGARVCSTTPASNVTVQFVWDSANTFVNTRPGSQTSLTLPAIAANGCADAYFEAQITRDPAAFDTVRRYHITATDGVNPASTPVPRELYVEHLISQSRNSITGIKVDGVSIPAGGSVGLVVGNTYVIELDGGTATQGYNQFEAFINLSNAIFQIQSVQTTYSADNSPFVPGPAPTVNDKLYADACKWESNPASPNYRSCVGGDFKAGGSNVVTLYTIRIISGGGTSQALSTLLYDFSGSSFHYNADFGVHGIVANIIDPGALTFAQQFAPASTAPGGTSTLTFTLGNPNPAAIGGAGFSDTLPIVGGGQMVVASPATFSTTGCGAPTFAPAAGATTLDIGNATIPANGTCTISVIVTVPASPSSGSYVNTSGNLIVGGIDTGHDTTATLGISATTPPTNVCGLALAQWTMAPAAGTSVPPAFSFKAADVASAAATAGVGITSTIDATIGNPVNSWSANGFSTAASLATSNDDYFQFAADTTNYTAITFSFDARLDNSLHGPKSLQLYSSTDGVTFTPYSGAIAPTAAFAAYAPAFGGTANASGLTYFRIYGYNAGNNGADADLYVDNVKIGGCGTAKPATIGKAFTPSSVVVGGNATLQFTLTNPNSVALTGASFSDSLPSGMQVASAPSATNTCGGTWAPVSGDTSLSFAAGTIPASGSCTIGVNVTVTTAGTHTNVSGFLATAEGGTNATASGSAVAALQALVPPSIAAAFAPASVQISANSVLTFTITNANAAVPLSAVSFTDAYPANLVNANPAVPAVANTCGGALTASPGGASITLAGGAVAAAGSCTISVPVTSAIAGNYAITTSNVSDAAAGTGNTASATLDVSAPSPGSSVLKQIATSATGPWFAFVAVAPNTPLYYRFTVENTGDVPLDPFGVSDPVLAAAGIDPAGCAWQTSNSPSTLPTLPVASATLDPTATCVVGPVLAALGARSNTAIAQGTFNGSAFASAASTADYIGAVPGFSLVKEVATSPLGPWSSAIGAPAGNDVFYRFTLVNTGALDLSGIGVTDAMVDLSSCTFTDPLVVGDATTCTVGPVIATGSAGTVTVNTAIGHGTNGGSGVDTPSSSASFTISSANADLAIANTDGVGSVSAGGSTTYTVSVSNNGPDDVTDAAITDTAPAELTFGAWSCAVTNAGSGGSAVTACGTPGGIGNVDTTATLQPGAIVTYTIVADVDSAASGSLTTTAKVAAPAGVFDAVATNDGASDTDTVIAGPPPPPNDLAIGIDDGTPAVTSGAGTAYTITVANGGGTTITGAILDNPAIAGLVKTLIACAPVPGQCVTPPTVIELDSGAFALPPLAPGATYAITVFANVTVAGGALANTATIAMPTGVTDDNPANNSATDVDIVAPPLPGITDLGVATDNGATTLTSGTATNYIVTVINNGPSTVTGAVLADPSVTGLDKSGVTCAAVPGQCVTPPTRTELESGAFALPTLAPGQSYAIVVTATVTVLSGSVTNAAAVAVPGGVIDPVPANDGASDTDVVLPPPPPPTGVDLAITASASATTVSPGGHLWFTLTLTNNGPAGVTNAVLTDIAPAGVTFGNWTCTVANAGSGGGVTTACGAASGTGNVTTTVTMQPGAVLTYVIAATVAANASGNVVDTASANVPAGVTDSSPANNTSTAAVSVQAAPAAAPQPIPTLGQWGVILLSLLMLVAAAGGMRRRVQRG
jgi:uncharacterized repeat protein (TIGR01451 family)